MSAADNGPTPATFASLKAFGDASPGTSPATDASPGAAECRWCRSPLEVTARRRDARYCSKRCRQTAFRLRVRAAGEERTGPSAGPLRVAYADPPYPGLSARYYADQPSFAGEVDHPALIARLVAEYDGWALSTGAYALRSLLPLCPPDVRVCAWTKPHGASPATYGPHNVWEPVLLMPARRRRPGVRDALSALPARGGGELPGRKPLAFCAWLFALLGLTPGDTFVDLFPGTGIVGRAWAEICRSAPAPGDVSLWAHGDVSPEYCCDVAAGVGDASCAAARDVSEVLRDASRVDGRRDASLLEARQNGAIHV